MQGRSRMAAFALVAGLVLGMNAHNQAEAMLTATVSRIFARPLAWGMMMRRLKRYFFAKRLPVGN